MNFVHELVDQVNPAPMVGLQVFTLLWIALKIWTEPWSRIGHDNYDSPLRIRLQPAPNLF